MSAEYLARELLTFAEQKLRLEMGQIERCAGLLRDDEVWRRHNEHTNSVGNLTLHLAGNVRQWVLGGLGGQVIERDRPAEFAACGPRPTMECGEALRSTLEAACAVLAGLDAAALARKYVIQEYEVAGAAAVGHVVEHFSWHVGQIVHMTKALRNGDLSLYDAQGHRLDGTHP